MHDIDRTTLEYDPETEDDDETGFFELEGEYESGYEDDDEGEYEYAFEQENGYDGEYYEEEVFDEAELEALASELLGVTDDEELEQFLGKVFRRAGRRIRRAVKSKAGRALGRLVKRAAKKVLPIAGSAVGTVFGGPAGGAIGGRVGSGVGRALGLELEGLSPEDQEFEVAKQVVRLAGDAAKQVTKTQTRMPPAAAAKAAVAKAAKRHAPGLIKSTARAPMPHPAAMAGSRTSGRWVRRGSKVVLMGL